MDVILSTRKRQSSTHVHIKQVSLAFGERQVLNKLSFRIPRDKITVIMGPSGCGKTTLLKLIGGQLRPDSGEVLVDGASIQRLDRSELFAVRQHMGRLFQSGALFSHINVFENVAFPLREHLNLPEELLRDIVLMTLETVGLRGAAHLLPTELSGGMSRRVALARAIVMDPDLMMYDEPLTGQDPISVGVLLRLIKHLNKTFGMTSIIVSHNIKAISTIADHMVVIGDGRLIAQGSPQALLKSEQPRVQQFMQGLPDGVVPFHYPAPDIARDLGLC